MREYTPLWSEKWDKLFAVEGARGRQDHLDGLSAEDALESLQRRFDSLAALLTPQVSETDSVKSLLQGAKDDIAAQKNSNAILLRRLPTQYRVPRSGQLANKVFAMPELLEHILSFTSVPDLLRLYRVNHVFYNTIEGSTTLQRRLGMQPNPSAHLEQPAEHLVYHPEGMDMTETYYCSPSLPSDQNTQLEPNAVPIKINVCTWGALGRGSTEKLELRPLGERCRKLLITQPPIKEMGVYMQCCTPSYRPYRDRQPDPPIEVLKSETGITVHQIWEAVAKAQKEHRLCPNADVYDHDSEGFVQLRMSIEGYLTLKDDDPALVSRQKRRKEFDAEDDEVRSKEAKFRPYIAAKQAGECAQRRDLREGGRLTRIPARNNGEPIPTFAEFEAKAREGDSSES